MNKVALALLIAFAISILVVAADLYTETRSQPISRPPGLEGQTQAVEYSWQRDSPTGARWLLQPVEQYLKQLPPHASVIDVGCGNGSFLASFRGRGWKLVGIDLSNSGINIARSQWPDIRFEIADATADLSSVGYGSFDAVISTNVVEHVFLPRKFAINCFKLLKPGGTLVISAPFHGYAKNLGIVLSNQLDAHFEPLQDYGHIKFWSVETLARLLFETGFEQLEWRGAGRFPHLWKDMIIKARVPPDDLSWAGATIAK